MNKTLEIFALCERLARLLGNTEAIADLQRLYKKHPEMFRDMQEVSEVIQAVVHEPDLVMRNPYFTKEQEFLAAKKLDSKKMGDVIIKNNKGTNEIFHVNKKRIRDFRRLQRVYARLEVDGGDAHSLHTAGQAYTGANVVSSTLSSTPNSIIPQNKTFAAKLPTESTNDRTSE